LSVLQDTFLLSTPKSPSLAPPKRLREGEGGLFIKSYLEHPPRGLGGKWLILSQIIKTKTV